MAKIFWLTLRTNETGDFQEYRFPTRELAEKRKARLEAIDGVHEMVGWCQYVIWEMEAQDD